MERIQEEFDLLIEYDIGALWRIHDYFHSHPRLLTYMSSIVSKHPWNDVCAIIWIIAVLGIVEIGNHYFWVVCINLFAAFILRKVIQAKRPVEYDIRLQPISDVGAYSYGFPSLESYMSIIIMGRFFYYFDLVFFILWIPLSIAVVGVVGVSRLYAKSRFPHQIWGSWLLGLVGLPLSIAFLEKTNIHL